MKILAPWGLACYLALSFIGASCAHSQSASDYEIIDQARADRLGPGFRRTCSREISEIGAQAGTNDIPDAQNVNRLDSLVSRTKWAIGRVNEFGAASNGADPWWGPLNRYMFCRGSYVYSHWDDAGGTQPVRAAPLAPRVQPRPAPVVPPVPIARASNDAAAAAAAVSIQPEGFDKYADDALSGRSPAEVARDQTESGRLSAAEMAIESRIPIPHCTDSDDRAGYARCLKSRDEAIFHRAEEEMALLDRERPNMTEALYDSKKVRFRQDADLARNSCAKLASSASPCDLFDGSSPSSNLPSRVVARDGRRALDCVKLERLARSSSSTSGGGTVLVNQCTDTVTIGWCSTGGECERGAGNITNVLAGHSWPVDANHEVRWGACHGANTLHGDPGSKGLQFTCSAPEPGG